MVLRKILLQKGSCFAFIHKLETKIYVASQLPRQKLYRIQEKYISMTLQFNLLFFVFTCQVLLKHNVVYFYKVVIRAKPTSLGRQVAIIYILTPMQRQDIIS